MENMKIMEHAKYESEHGGTKGQQLVFELDSFSEGKRFFWSPQGVTPTKRKRNETERRGKTETKEKQQVEGLRLQV